MSLGRARATVLTIAIMVVVAGYGLVQLFGLRTEDQVVQVQRLPVSGVTLNGTPDQVRFEQGPADPPVPFVTDGLLVGLPGGEKVRLAEIAAAPLAGWLTPVAVPSPDRRFMAYNSWRASTTTPSLRLYDLQTGEDSLFEEGAYSLAWRSDGRIAYFKGTRRNYVPNKQYLGHVMVRSSMDAKAVRWTRKPAQFIVAAWAGEHLLVYREIEGHAHLELLSGPGKIGHFGNASFLVAVSPDGTSAFVASTAEGDDPARILRVPDGKELARIDLFESANTATGEPIGGFLAYGGSWVGDRIVADFTSGLIVFDVADGTLGVERVLNLVPDPFPVGTHEPQFADADGTRVVAWAPMNTAGGPYAYVDCDLLSLRCVRGAAQDRNNFNHAYNPSRPMTGG